MDRLDPLRRLLAESSDPDNPPAAQVGELFETMRRIAVIGLSRDPRKAARRVPSYLAAQGYEVVGVNPFADRLLGRPAHATVAEVDGELDLVVIFRPSGEAGRFVSEASERPERPAIWLQEGIRADPEASAVRQAGRFLVQDLCTYKVHRALFT
jgi:predicted CoA-binding protein